MEENPAFEEDLNRSAAMPLSPRLRALLLPLGVIVVPLLACNSADLFASSHVTEARCEREQFYADVGPRCSCPTQACCSALDDVADDLEGCNLPETLWSPSGEADPAQTPR